MKTDEVKPMKTGAELIAEERERQITQEGWTPEHDDKHMAGEMALAAATYAIPSFVRDLSPPGGNKTFIERLWPWALKWWKPTPRKRIKELVKSGALIAAEIDRLQRARKDGGK